MGDSTPDEEASKLGPQPVLPTDRPPNAPTEDLATPSAIVPSTDPAPVEPAAIEPAAAPDPAAPSDEAPAPAQTDAEPPPAP